MNLKVAVFDQRGSATLWAVMFLVIFAVLLSASLQFITRQAHTTIVQEQEEQAFAAAEAGLHHVLWLLNSGTETIPSLSAKTIVHEPVINDAGDVVAHFSLTYSNLQPNGLTVASVGSDAGRVDICQSITGIVSAAPAGGYVLTQWDHTVTANCPAPAGSGKSGGSIATFPINLINQLIPKNLSAVEPSHRYVFSGSNGDLIRLKVRSTEFTPLITLKDPAGVVIASAGHEWRLAHVRYEATLRRWQDNLLAKTGAPLLAVPNCNSSVYLACIPRDIDDLNEWYTLPVDGLYQLDLVSSNLILGSYSLETEKQ